MFSFFTLFEDMTFENILYLHVCTCCFLIPFLSLERLTHLDTEISQRAHLQLKQQSNFKYRVNLILTTMKLVGVYIRLKGQSVQTEI